ncbi:acyltransferase [Sphingomonas naphthae]|uniref:Acyltransferase n=1 Tax=Sphingomonas naphthae TaxID=1813468 RepID=A0ABY7TL19_9SPHN|nr:acyltransferase [Sphingomonas naphthae]WCT73481.1 acyltransferase [Sphingomonas naphthae]
MTTDTVARRPVLHGLTGLRFVAALLVLLFHYGAGFADKAGLPWPVVTLLHNGYLGVSLFFMLSGFIITYTYDGRIGSRRAFRDYAVARFARLYPVYLLALLMALPFAMAKLTAGQAIAVMAMLQSWTLPASGLGLSWVMQAWTLSVELFFYLAAPLLLILVRPLQSRGLLALAAVLAVAIAMLWVPSIPPGTKELPFAWQAWVPIPLLRLIEFAFGMILCKLFIRHPGAAARLAAPAIVAANILIILALVMTTQDRAVTGAAMVLGGLLMVQLAARDTFASRLLSTKPMLLLGASSYALYLIQWPVREWLRLLPSAGLAQLLNPFVAIGLSILIFLYWEEPARRWLRDRLTGGRGARVGRPATQPDIGC